WTHMRTIVLTRGLLGDIDEKESPPRGEMGDDALRAILAHELHHWDAGHVVALQFLWACSWPLALLFNVATWLWGRRGFLALVGWLALWPTWVITKFLIVPMTA